jgi:hypothetical protein
MTLPSFSENTRTINSNYTGKKILLTKISTTTLFKKNMRKMLRKINLFYLNLTWDSLKKNLNIANIKQLQISIKREKIFKNF